MNLEKEIDDFRKLAGSIWVRCGVALQAAAGIVVGFFVIDAKWGSGNALISLLLADGIDGPGRAFDAVRYGMLLLTIAGLVCITIGCVKIHKQPNNAPNQLIDRDGSHARRGS